MKTIGLYLSISPESGGSFQYCQSILNNIQKMDKKKYKLKIFIKNKIWKKYLPKKLNVIELKKKKLFDKYINYLSLFIFSKSYFKKICNKYSSQINQINREECDLVIFPGQEPVSSQIFAKSITTIHDLMHRYEPQFKEYSFIEKMRRDFRYKKICNNSIAILVDSKLGKKQVIESYNVNRNKLFVFEFQIPEYLKTSKIIDIYKKYKIPKKKFIFYPAQFWQHKNHLNLIYAFNLILKKNIDINLILVGAEKNNLSNVKNKIHELGIEKNVFILGYIPNEDVFSFYKKSSLLSFVSHLGPTNIPPLEAIYSGCPVVCSNIYAMKTQLRGAALMVNPNSYFDIYKKIKTILENNKIQKKLINNGYQIIKRKKKEKNICDILEKLLKKIK